MTNSIKWFNSIKKKKKEGGKNIPEDATGLLRVYFSTIAALEENKGVKIVLESTDLRIHFQKTHANKAISSVSLFAKCLKVLTRLFCKMFYMTRKIKFTIFWGNLTFYFGISKMSSKAQKRDKNIMENNKGNKFEKS